MSEELRVIELKAESFMGIKLAELKLDENGDLVVIGGRNGQGKTSLLNAIECAIRGKSHHPEMPVQKGAESAEINLDLGAYKIRRRFKADGNSSIQVSNAEGFRSSTPQSLLDGLAQAISFDPLAFSRMDSKKQLEVVRELAGVDTTEIDKKYRGLYAQRMEINAVAKNMSGEISAMPFTVNAEKVSITTLLEDLEFYRAANGAREEALRAVDADREVIRAQHEEIETGSGRIEKMREALEVAITQRTTMQRDVADLGEYATAAEAEALAMPVIVLDDLQTEISMAEDRNRRVAENEARHQREADLAAKMAASASCTNAMEALATKKAKLIEDANLPVEGLSFTTEGVTLAGVPFSQSSGAESLAASVMIGMALHPKLKVMLIRDGSLLDKDSMELLANLAKDEEYQIWIERVGHADDGVIVIEAGEVVGAERAEESEVEATAGDDLAQEERQ